MIGGTFERKTVSPDYQVFPAISVFPLFRCEIVPGWSAVYPAQGPGLVQIRVCEQGFSLYSHLLSRQETGCPWIPRRAWRTKTEYADLRLHRLRDKGIRDSWRLEPWRHLQRQSWFHWQNKPRPNSVSIMRQSEAHGMAFAQPAALYQTQESMTATG